MSQHREPDSSRATCPLEQLEWFVNRTLSSQEQASVEAHLNGCSSCRAKVITLTRLRLSMQEMSRQTPAPRADLFLRIEQQIDALPQPALQSWQHTLPQTCRFALRIAAEHCHVQLRLLRNNLFWMPLFIVPFVFSLVYLPQFWPQTPSTAALLAALINALGMAFLYGQKIDPAREITLVTQTSPHLILGIRCGLVFGYDLLLNCGLILPFLALHGVVTPAWFLTNWLAPLCCLSAISLFLSILINASTSLLVCALLWLLRSLNGMQALLFGEKILPTLPWQQHYESFWHQPSSLFAIAILTVLLTFVVLERKERFIQSSGTP